LNACIETVHAAVLIIYRGFGLTFPRINDRPILSTTLAEFWGRRWNRAVSGWLHDNLFVPLARRRRPTLGICAAFAGSTALHFWFAWIPLDVFAGLLMASFFVVHGVGLLLERHIGVHHWGLGARRAWTAAWIAVPSPLFVEPALRLLAGLIRS
jgi:alginate O-acetyltransferase complex protein AlgI